MYRIFSGNPTANPGSSWWTEFDAIWALARALNASQDSLPDNKTLGDFTYEDHKMAEVIFQKLKQQEFFGASVSTPSRKWNATRLVLSGANVGEVVLFMVKN